MSRSPVRHPACWPILGAALVALCLGGCGSESRTPGPSLGSSALDEDSGLNGAQVLDEDVRGEDKRAILAGVLQLIGSAALNPGGANFTLATSSLNDYFLDTAAEKLTLPEPMRAYLKENAGQFPGDPSRIVQSNRFDVRWDAMFIEDCLLMRDMSAAILARGAEGASDLDRAKRLFEWVARQVQLVPPGSLADPGLTRPDGSPAQVPSRPSDVSVRGMATEIEGGWAERSWLFLALCRQAKLDAGYLALILPRTVLSGRSSGPIINDAGLAQTLRPESSLDISFACGVAINQQIYLFDAKLGTPIFAPDGSVATLAQATADPSILAALDLPGHPYPVKASGLASGKVRVLLEAPHCSLSPRMKLLQEELTGDRRMVLFRDPTEVAAVFSQAIGPQLDAVRLWNLPLQVEFSQFNDPSYNRAVIYPLRYFDAKLPMLNARLMQLRGELTQSIQEYVKFRFSEDTMMADGKTPIPTQVQTVLDGYSTYFLALAKLEQGESTADEARFLFSETLRILPEPGPNQPIHFMFRWGAQANIARLLAAAGKPDEAVRFATLPDPTGQEAGNYVFARDLLWKNPFPPQALLPVPPEAPKPKPSSAPRRTQATPPQA